MYCTLIVFKGKSDFLIVGAMAKSPYLFAVYVCVDSMMSDALPKTCDHGSWGWVQRPQPDLMSSDMIVRAWMAPTCSKLPQRCHTYLSLSKKMFNRAVPDTLSKRVLEEGLKRSAPSA